jgi:hypothetical protein
MRLYVSGDNLVTISDMFQVIDPERVALNARGVIYPQVFPEAVKRVAIPKKDGEIQGYEHT